MALATSKASVKAWATAPGVTILSEGHSFGRRCGPKRTDMSEIALQANCARTSQCDAPDPKRTWRGRLFATRERWGRRQVPLGVASRALSGPNIQCHVF